MYLFTESAASLLFLDEVKEQQVKKQSPAVQTADKFPLVLVADEDGDTRLMMNYLLSLWNYRVIEAASEEETIEAAKEQRPDLILISDKFSRIDGLTTIRRIREMRELDHAIVIFINGYAEPAIHASAIAAGADDSMTKPIDFGRLEAKLAQFLNKSDRSGLCFGGENL